MPLFFSLVKFPNIPVILVELKASGTEGTLNPKVPGVQTAQKQDWSDFYMYVITEH